MTGLILFALLLLQIGLGAGAALATRPLTVDDAFPLDRGKIKLETAGSINVASFRNEAFSLEYPFSLAVGVIDRLELGLGTSYLRRHPAEEKPPTGFTDLIFAPKIKLVDQGKISPHLATTLGLKIPTASRPKGLGNNKTEFNLNLMATRTFDKFSLLSMVSWFYKNSFRDIEGVRVNPRNVLLAGLATEVPLTKKFTLVGEIVGQNQETPDEPDLWKANVGLRYAPWEFITFDAALAKGFGRSAQPKLGGTIGFTLVWGLWAKPPEKKAAQKSLPFLAGQ